MGRNLEAAEGLVRRAAEGGARLVVLPELFGTGSVFAKQLAGLAEEGDGPALGLLGRLSAELGVHVAGSLLMREAGRVHNTLVLAAPGGKVQCYAKQHPLLWERSFCQPGGQAVVAETDLGRLGLLVGWDIAHPKAWQAYAGRVDAMVVASAAPRLHRAVLNFPRGRRVYLAQLMPALLKRRAEMDDWYTGQLGARAAWLGVPLVHAGMAGRFVSALPMARRSSLALALVRPRYWPLAFEAHLATMRATFYGGSAIYDARGEVVAQVGGGPGGSDDEGLAVGSVALGGAGGRPRGAPPSMRLPWQVRGVNG